MFKKFPPESHINVTTFVGKIRHLKIQLEEDIIGRKKT